MKSEVRRSIPAVRHEGVTVCPKFALGGANWVYVGIVTESQPPFAPSIPDAQRERAKGRLYVACQLSGFSLLFVVQLFFANFFQDPQNDYGSLSLSDVMVQFYSVFVGLVITHYARRYIDRWGWKQLGWLRLIPRLVGLAVLLATIWVIFVQGWYFGVMQREFPANISPPILFLIGILNSSFVVMGWLSVYFIYHVFDRFNRSEIERLRLATVVKDAELRALKSQVNPHFIFNSRNSVRALIDEDPTRARSAVTQLANMLRYSLQSGTKQTVPFEDELTRWSMTTSRWSR